MNNVQTGIVWATCSDLPNKVGKKNKFTMLKDIRMARSQLAAYALLVSEYLALPSTDGQAIRQPMRGYLKIITDKLLGVHVPENAQPAASFPNKTWKPKDQTILRNP